VPGADEGPKSRGRFTETTVFMEDKKVTAYKKVDPSLNTRLVKAE
tara:strand:+ start:291 stop:425 length:135 start_codon:yes stop_codon:yes gene_type:complete